MQPARAGAPQPHGTLRSVQIMRGLAAFMVVAHHCAWKGHQYSVDPWRGFRVGEAGVDLFFVISGFIMCEATSRRAVGFLAFMRARALRILPLYWLLTAVAWVCWRIAPQWVNSKGGETVVWPSFLLVPSTGMYLIQNGWTLSYEFLFYVIFGLGLLWKGAARHALPFTLLVLLAGAGLVWQPDSLAGQYFTHASLFEFAMGIASYHVLRRLQPGPALSAVFIAAGVAGLAWANQAGWAWGRTVAFGLPCWALFLGLAGLERGFARVHTQPWARALQAVGDSSYSLYLVHIFALGAAALLLRDTALAAHGTLFMLALMASALAAGFACYHLLERPLSRLFHRAR